MRTLLIIVVGVAVLALMLFLGRRFQAASAAVRLFLAFWFFIAAINMWIGISTAGYTFVEELPVFVLIFGLPAGMAWYLTKKPAKRDTDGDRS